MAAVAEGGEGEAAVGGVEVASGGDCVLTTVRRRAVAPTEGVVFEVVVSEDVRAVRLLLSVVPEAPHEMLEGVEVSHAAPLSLEDECSGVSLVGEPVAEFLHVFPAAT